MICQNAEGALAALVERQVGCVPMGAAVLLPVLQDERAATNGVYRHLSVLKLVQRPPLREKVLGGVPEKCIVERVLVLQDVEVVEVPHAGVGLLPGEGGVKFLRYHGLCAVGHHRDRFVIEHRRDGFLDLVRDDGRGRDDIHVEVLLDGESGDEESAYPGMLQHLGNRRHPFEREFQVVIGIYRADFVDYPPKFILFDALGLRRQIDVAGGPVPQPVSGVQ